MKIGHKEFSFYNHSYIMGILNVTPDSFSDGGRFVLIDEARRQVRKMIEEGADIIDIGGESTRPGHEEVSEEEEISRVVPVIKMITEEFDTVVSIDTSKATVAEAAIKAGAHMVNDVWGLKKDSKMAHVIAKHHVPVCIMHNRENDVYEDLIMDIVMDLGASIKIGMDQGIQRDKIIIDPGIGFGKRIQDNLILINHLEEFHELGAPVMVGASRKAFLGSITGIKEAGRRDIASLGAIAAAAIRGANLVRVHNVGLTRQVLQVVDAIRRAG